VSVLFGKLSGAAGGGTIETILNQVATEPFRDQRAAADPYCLNPPSARSSHQSALSRAAVSCTGCISHASHLAIWIGKVAPSVPLSPRAGTLNCGREDLLAGKADQDLCLAW